MLAVTASVSAASEAMAEIVEWGEAGGWFVSVDTDFQPRSCFAAAEFENENYMRIGIDPAMTAVYVVLANSEWAGVEEGSIHPVEMVFGDESPWSLDMEAGLFSNGLPFLYAFTDNWLVLDEFAHEVTAAFVVDGVPVAALDLSGSEIALAALLDCQRTMDLDAGELSERRG